MTISVSHLSKYYQVHKKEPGIFGSFQSLVVREYETVKAVEDISFDIQEGELVGFIGPNGAGKTTTLKCLSGLLYPTHGSISVLGHMPYKREKEYLKSIALVMGQKNQLWWDLPAIDTLLLNKEIYEVSEKRFNEVVGQLSDLLEVEELLKVPVKKLSLGERMKCELIASLVHTPKVLFLDEPTIGLDVVMQKKLRDFIGEYNKRFDATIILTSHYMKDVEALCKRVIIINNGKLLFDGQLASLIKKHTPYKILRVILNEPVDLEKIEKLGKVRKFIYPELIVEIPKEKISEIASELLKSFVVDDLTIEDVEIEDVIRKVFGVTKG